MKGLYNVLFVSCKKNFKALALKTTKNVHAHPVEQGKIATNPDISDQVLYVIYIHCINKQGKARMI